VTSAKMDLSAAGADHAAADFAQATPVATITLTGDQGTQALEVRKKASDDFAKSSAAGGVYKVDASLGTAVDKGLGDFRDKKIFDLGFEEPSKIEYHDGARALFLTHSGTDWWQNGKKMDGAAVDSLIDKLRDLTATSFPDSGFSNPGIEVTVTSSDGKQIEKAEISKSGNNYMARRENDPSLYQLDAGAVTDLTNAANAIKPATAPAK
jgi:hypothetical protein